MPLSLPSWSPPGSAQGVNTLHLAQPGSTPQHSPVSMFRSSDGKTRMDTGNTSVITDPHAGVTTILNHATKQAHITPFTPPAPPGAPPAPAMPKMPAAPSAAPPAAPPPPAQPPNVQDLGKKVIDGEEAEGKRIVSGSHTTETWTSTKLHLPVLTTTSGPFGQQISKFKMVPGEPDPKMFQIPPGYTQISPPK